MVLGDKIDSSKLMGNVIEIANIKYCVTYDDTLSQFMFYKDSHPKLSRDIYIDVNHANTSSTDTLEDIFKTLNNGHI